MSDLAGKAELAAARLEFDQYSHDVYVLMYVGELTYLHDSLRTGAPVQISVANENGTADFIGYVHHVGLTTGHHEGGKPMTTLYCIGSSYPLKQLGNNTWSSNTISQIVEDIADRFSFATDIDSEFNFAIPTYLQGNRSYWEVLRELAIDYGALLKVEGTTIRFLKPAKAAKRWAATAPVLTHVPDQSQLLSVAGTPFTQFALTSGQLMTTDLSWQAKKIIRGVDAITAEAIYSEGTPDTFSRGTDTTSPFDHLLTVPVSSPAEARAYAEGAANRDRHPHTARITSSGNPFVVSDRPIFVQGVGSSTGTWTVRKAYHDIQLNGVYQMTLDVGTDGLGDSLDEFDQSLRPTLMPNRRVIDDYLHDRHETQPNYYLHRISVLPLVGKTGSQYVSAQWKSKVI
jgi:phage protein D